MLTNKDKAFLSSLKWKWKDIEYLENDLKEGRIREPYFIRSVKGEPLAEVWRVGGKQCLHIF